MTTPTGSSSAPNVGGPPGASVEPKASALSVPSDRAASDSDSTHAIRGATRWLDPSSDPVDQATVMGLISARRLPGIVPIRRSVLVDARVEVEEELTLGVALGSALDAIEEHVSTAVALGLVRDAALALAGLHGLDRARPPIHGRLDLAELLLGADGRIRVAGVQGRRGDPQEDVRALLGLLRALLRAKAQKPGGAALLDRLSALRFVSALDLHQTIESHLLKQAQDRLGMARARFTERVLAAVGGPRWVPEGRTAEGPFEAIRATSASTGDALASRPRFESVVDDLELAGEAPSLSSEPTRSEAHHGLGALRPTEPTEGGPSTDISEARPALDATEATAPRASGSWLQDPIADDVFEAEGSDERSAPTAKWPIDPLALAEVEGRREEEEEAFTPRASRSAGRPGGEGPPVRPRGPPPPPVPDRDGVEAAMAAARDALMAPAAAREEKRSTAVLVGAYRVVAAIGKGGMGEIYLARSTESERLVALKVLAADDSADDEALGMLMDEAAIMARIEHPHVLKVVDFGRSHGRYYLATEYLEGRPLVRVMIESYDRDGGMDHATVACIGAQAARGLFAAHTATTSGGAPLEVVHRDVSPQNIFVTYVGETKVIDFGVARATERFSRTQVGLVKGKAAYMSPEQAEGRPLDARSDVFSLGVCLWEMIAGKRLFKQPLDYDTLIAVQTAPIEPPSLVRGQPDPALDRIVLAALHRDLSQRTASARVLAEQLEGYARGRGIEDPRPQIRGVMTRMFFEEAEKERRLVAQLEARAATEEEVASLRELSGVSHRTSGREITLVAEPDGLGALDRYGEARREVTGERVIQKVRQLEAERRSGEYPAASELPRRSPWEGLGVASSLPVPEASPPRKRRWVWVAAAFLSAVAALALVLAHLDAPPRSSTRREGMLVRTLTRPEFAALLRASGVEVDPIEGAFQRVEGLGGPALMLDEDSRLRRVEREETAGWLLELTPVDGGPAVVWVTEGERGLLARGLSVNDCPASAQIDPLGIEIRYGGGGVRLPHGGGRLTDVVLSAPSGATRLELRPLGIAFGALRAGSEATRCPTGWEPDARVLIRRLPVGSYILDWSGPGLSQSGALRVTAAGVDGADPL